MKRRQRVLIKRATAVIGVLAGGALLLIASMLPWARGTASQTVGGSSPVEVTGAQGAALVPSAALVILAAGLAIGLSGRIARVVAAVAVALSGLLALFAAIGFISNPMPALRHAAAQASGVPELSDAIRTTVWPVVAMVIAAAMALLGIVLPFIMGAWQRVGTRYDRGGTPASQGGVRGQQNAANTGTGTGTGTDGASSAGGPRQRISDWDALSRGEDPSDSEDR